MQNTVNLHFNITFALPSLNLVMELQLEAKR